MSETASIATAYVDIKANTKQYKTAMSGVKKSLFDLKPLMGKMFAGGALIAGGMALIKSAKAVVSAFNAEEESIATLNAIIKSTEGAAGISSKAMIKWAQDFQGATTVSNDVVISIQAMVATFKGIKGDAFNDTTETIFDMATVMKTDAKSAAIQMGKAMNNPIKGAASLARVGVEFTKAQKDQIAVLQKSGDLLGAQAIIMKELKSEFGGAARALRDTFGGAIKGMNNDLQDLGKQIIRAFQGTGIKEGVSAIGEGAKELTAFIAKVADTTPWKIFVASIKANFRLVWLYIKAPFVMFIAILKDVWTAIKGKLEKPLTSMLKVLGKIIPKFASLADELGNALIDVLPNGMKETKKAAHGLKDELEDIGSDLVNSAKPQIEVQEEIAKVHKNNTEEFVKDEKKKQAAVKKTGAAGLRDLMQQAMLSKEEGAAGVTAGTSAIPGVAGITPTKIPQQGSKLGEILTAILMTNDILNKQLEMQFLRAEGGLT